MASRFFPRSRLLLRLFVVFVLTLAWAGGIPNAASADNVSLSIKTDKALHTFTVEVMQNPADRARGLMHRKHLDADHGMLFDFGEPINAMMWMKNTYIPLDMLFIRSDGKIANIARDTVPLSTEILGSKGLVRYVLEINAGLSMKLGISPGDHVVVPGAAH